MKTEITHVNKALKVNGYPNWILKQQKQEVIDKNQVRTSALTNRNTKTKVVQYFHMSKD